MPDVGDQLAHYRVEQLLGAGGMGEVYVAFDLTLERRVALKLLPASRAHVEARLRMLREARAASALQHPGLVTVFEIGEVDGRTFIAMELVEGETLSHRIARDGAVEPAVAVALLRQIADAITAAHAAGILHRDLKPANLMIDRAGKVKVLDFGLSKRMTASSQPPSDAPRPAIDAEAETLAPEDTPVDAVGATATPADVLTRHGARMGTPGWAAPELMAGEDADVRSDVFSLGVVLHELVTGKPPFPWTSWEDIRQRIFDHRYPRAAHPALAAVIARALQPKREDRYATVAELVAAAEAAVHPPRRRWPIVVGGGVVAAGVVIAVAAWPRGVRTAAAPPPAPVLVTGDMKLPERRALTTSGGCAYTPAFVDARTVVYDLTPANGTSDLWSIPVTGGDPTHLTDGAQMEYRAASGRTPGTVIYLQDDYRDVPAEQLEPAGIIELDVATKQTTKLSGVSVPGAAAAGGVLYYLIGGGTELRRVRGSIDEQVLSIESNPEQIVASPDGKWIALAGPPPQTPLTLVEVAAATATKLPAAVPGNSRPAFSAFTSAIYYLGAAGVRRIRLDGTGDELVAPEVPASGGLAVAPDGAALVYSTCDLRAQMFDLSASPRVVVVKEKYGAQPIAGPNGWLAWLSQALDTSVLMVRRPDGTVEQLTTSAGGRVDSPAFDRAGTAIAFAVSGGDHPGVKTLALDQTGGTRRVFGMSGREGDVNPLFVGDELVFTRFDDQGIPYVFRTPAAGGRVERALDDPGIGYSVSGNGYVVVGTGPANEWRMWNPATGKTAMMRLPGDLVGIPRFSPDGAWIAVTGDAAVYRVHDDVVEKVYDIPPDGLAGFATITDDGHVIAAPNEWSGELWVIDAPPHTRW